MDILIDVHIIQPLKIKCSFQCNYIIYVYFVYCIVLDIDIDGKKFGLNKVFLIRNNWAKKMVFLREGNTVISQS